MSKVTDQKIHAEEEMTLFGKIRPKMFRISILEKPNPDTPILKHTLNERPQLFDLQGIIFLKSLLTI